MDGERRLVRMCLVDVGNASRAGIAVGELEVEDAFGRPAGLTTTDPPCIVSMALVDFGHSIRRRYAFRGPHGES